MRLLALLALLAPVAGLSWLLEAEDAAPVREVVRQAMAPVPPATLAPGRRARPHAVALEDDGVSISGRIIASDGRPVVSARVLSLDDDDSVRASALTDRTGVFHLVGAFWDGHVEVDAGSRGRASVWLDDESRSDLRIGLVPGAVLRGRVLAPDGRGPAPHARLVAEEDAFGRVETRAREDGTFVLSPVPADRSFELFADGGSEGRTVLEHVRWADRSLEIVLRRTRAVRGRVVEERADGALVGVPGVEVEVQEGQEVPPGASVRADDEGRFTCHVLGWKGAFRVRSARWYQAGDPVRIPVHGEALVRVRRRATLVGRCVRQDGSPVSGAEVWCTNSVTVETIVSDATGRFEIRGVGVTRLHGVKITAYRGAWVGYRRVTEYPEDGEVYEVRMKRTASVSGRVLDEGGEPLACGWVCVSYLPRPIVRPEDLEFECGATDGDGRFVVGELGVGPCEVEIEAAGFDVRTIKAFATVAGTSLGDVRLRRLRRREGRLVDPQGQPIATGTFEVEEGAYRPIPVDAGGRFQVDLPTEGESNINFAAPGFVGKTVEVRALPANGEWIVVLEPSPFITGQVLDPAGRPLVDVAVWAKGVGHEGEGWACTDVGGRFRMEVTEPGLYEVDLTTLDHALSEPVLIRAGATDLTLRPDARPTLSGQVLGPDGCGLAGVGVTATDYDAWRGESWHTLTDEAGRFRLTGLEGRAFDVSLKGLADGVDVAPLQEVFPDEEDVTIQAVHTLAIEGRLVGFGRATAGSYSVRLEPIGRKAPSRFVPVDEDGYFSIPGLLPGLYQVRGMTGSPQRGKDVTERARVEAGSENLVLVLLPEEAR